MGRGPDKKKVNRTAYGQKKKSSGPRKGANRRAKNHFARAPEEAPVFRQLPT